MTETSKTAKKKKRRAAFLAALSGSANVRAACHQAGIGRATACRWRDHDASFAAEWDSALNDAVDLLELEAFRRAVKGTERPVFYKGKRVGTIREYSDVMLIFLLKANRPEKYRDHHAPPAPADPGPAVLGETVEA